MKDHPRIGVIGGSGLYEIEGLESVERREVETAFGQPSAPIILGKLEGRPIAFLARHGLGHHLSPSEINYRANIAALKMVGVERILSVSACGSLREDFAPGHVVVPNQLFDRTKGRPGTFFTDGIVAHVSVADPFCADLSDHLADAVEGVGGKLHRGGAFVTIEGPRFSTRAESNTYRAWGMSIIGMTTSPEAFLAREAEMCYAVMAHVTDYDVWHVSEKPVTVEMVIQILQSNAQLAHRALSRLARDLPADRLCDCGHALRDALITDPAIIPPDTRKRLSLLVDRYLP